MKIEEALDCLKTLVQLDGGPSDARALEIIRATLVNGQKPTTNSASLSCQTCKRKNCITTTCLACIRFYGERTDWHEQA